MRRALPAIFGIASVLFLVSVAPSLSAASPADEEKIQRFREKWDAAGAEPERQIELQADAIRELKGADSEPAAKIVLKLIRAKEIPYPIEDASIEVLSEMRSPEVVRLLSKEVEGGSRWRTRVIVANVLRKLKDPVSLPALYEALHAKRWAVRSAAVKAIQAMRRLESIDPLIERLAKEDYTRVAGEIQRALRHITQKDLGHYKEWELWWKANKETFQLPPEGADRPKKTGPDGRTVKTKTLYGTVISSRVIFVVDISESMKVVLSEGPDRGLSRMQIMKRELIETINFALPEDAMFNIIAYGTEVRVWRSKMVDATNKMRGEAAEWVDRLDLAGETNIMGALDAALGDRAADTIYFLSDGSPSTGRITNTVEILGEVKKMNGTRSVEINTIALLGGDGKLYKLTESKPLARDFLQKLAEQNGGTYQAFE